MNFRNSIEALEYEIRSVETNLRCVSMWKHDLKVKKRVLKQLQALRDVNHAQMNTK